MATSMLNSMILLSKEIGDYWSSTTTSSGSTTTIVDTALKAYPNSWIDSQSAMMWDQITSGTYDEEERKITSLDNGTLNTLAHGGTIASGVTYMVHRLFSGSEKRRALVNACKFSYPSLFGKIRDETMVSGNWLKDGSFEIWTSSSALTYWTTTTSTIAKTSTAYYFKHGKYSCKIDTAAGSIKQSVSNWDDLKRLAGKTVTFTAQGRSDTASCLRLAIYDGTDYTYSDYHNGDDVWTDDPLEVTATISDNPSVIEFYIYHDVAAGTSYVDDARVIGPYQPRIYIGNLGLTQNKPFQVLIEDSDYDTSEPWTMIHGIKYADGYMYLPDSVPRDYRLRIIGISYLDFYDSSGDVGTDWDDTVAIDSPQLEILIAQAAIYLWGQRVLPSWGTGENQQAQLALAYWENQLEVRIKKFAMKLPNGTINFASSG